MKKICAEAAVYLMIIGVFVAIALLGNRAITVIAEKLPGDRKHTIIIDAGHGGEDGGATSCTGRLESGFNLEIAQRLDDLLHLLGYRTKMIRTTDSSVYTHGSTIAEKKVSDLKQRVSIVNSTPGALLVSIHQNTLSDGRYSGVPSGFPTLDDITLGWQASDLIILAARPSVGKTAFALNVARNAAIQHFPVAIFSLEMPASQLVKRMMVSETGIDSKKLKGGVKLTPEDWKRLESKLKDLASAPIYIDDTPSLPVMEFRSKVKRLVKQKGVKLILVDYLQLMQGPSELRGMREQEVAAISRTLKATAKEHNVPIIALSQLSRQAVTRQTSNNRPQLSDLRESGSIEQDADMVLFIHRLDYQGLAGEDVQQGETKLIIAKHRNGEIGDVDLVFKASEARFVDGREEETVNSFASEASVREYQSKMNDISADNFLQDDGLGTF